MGCLGEQRCEAFTICRIKEKSIINKIRRLSFSSYDESGNLFFSLFYLLRAAFLVLRFFQEMMLEPLAAMTGQRKFFLFFHI